MLYLFWCCRVLCHRGASNLDQGQLEEVVLDTLSNGGSDAEMAQASESLAAGTESLSSLDGATTITVEAVVERVPVREGIELARVGEGVNSLSDALTNISTAVEAAAAGPHGQAVV